MIRDLTGLLSSDELVLVERAARAHPRSGEFLELVVQGRLGDGLSSARVFEAQWVAGGGRDDWCVLKLDRPCRLAREGELSARFPGARSFMSVAARSFATDEVDAVADGCIIYDHPAGQYGVRCRPLRERTAADLRDGSEASLARAIARTVDVVKHVTQQLQSGREGRSLGSGSKQLAFYRGYWFPSAIVEVRQRRCDSRRLHLELADEPVGVKIDFRQGAGALRDHVGGVVAFEAIGIYLDPAFVCVNVSDRAAIRIEGVDAVELARLLALPFGLHAAQQVSIRGRLRETQERFFSARITALDLNPAAAEWVLGGHRFANPLKDFEARVDGWRGRSPLPRFAHGHGDLHDGNVLCADSAVAIIDHAMSGPEQPIWSDAARLIGSSWLNAIVPQLERDEVVAVMASHGGGPPAPEGRARWAAAFLRGVIDGVVALEPEMGETARELWIDLHHFAWIACKWPGDARAQLAMLLLAAVAQVRVMSAHEALEASRALAVQPVGSREGVIEQVPAQIRRAMGLADALSVDFRRSLLKRTKEVLLAADAALERAASPGEGLLDRLLDEALAGTWNAVDTREAQALLLPSAEITSAPADRVLLADILYFACRSTGDLDVLSTLVGMFGDDAREVQMEAVLAVYLLLGDADLEQAVRARPALMRRVGRECSVPDVSELLLACVRNRGFWREYRSLLPEVTHDFPRAAWLRPFTVERDAPMEGSRMDPFWDVLSRSFSLACGEKRAIAVQWVSLKDRQRAEMRKILHNEVAFDPGSIGLAVAGRIVTLCVFEGHLASVEVTQSLRRRRRQLQSGLADLLADEGRAQMLRAVEALGVARSHVAVGRKTEAAANAQAALEAFAAASSLDELAPECLMEWGDTFGLLANLQSEVREARVLREAACEKYEAAVKVNPDAHEALHNWGMELGKLAVQCGDVNGARTLREAACEKYEAAVKAKPDRHEALYNWGVELGRLARQCGDKEKARTLLESACERYKAAVKVKPNSHESLYNWGSELSGLAGQCDDEEKAQTLREAACEKYEAAVKVKPDKHEALYNWGVELGRLAGQCDDKGKARTLREAACEKYEAAVKVKPDKHEALHNWGVELEMLAGQCGDMKEARMLRESACEKYEAAVKVKPDSHESLYNWGNELGEVAGQCGDMKEARILREAACEKYEAAVKVKPDKHDALENWGVQLCYLARACDTADAREGYREACFARLSAAAEILRRPVQQLYNYACALAVLGERGPALASLRTCLEAGSIERDHVLEDDDWAEFRLDPEWRMIMGLAN